MAASMEAGGDVLEQELLRDLAGAGWAANAKTAGDLYRALTNTAWTKEGLPGRVALSWARAESLVNELLEQAGEDPLALAQTGGEGDIADDVRTALGALGWRARPLDTSRDDPAHLAQPESAPPSGGSGPEWEREAHAEADEEIRRRSG